MRQLWGPAVIDFFKRLVNVYFTTVLMAAGLATWLLFRGLVTDVLWAGIINNALTVFVGGGFLRDGVIAAVAAYQSKEAS